MALLNRDGRDEAECVRLLMKFFRSLDEHDYETCLALFVEDAIWERKDAALKGREQIRAVLDARPRSVVICHQISNVEVDVISDSRVELRYLLIGYEAKVLADGSRPVGALGGMRRATDQLVRTDEGWKFQHKASKGVMLGILPH